MKRLKILEEVEKCKKDMICCMCHNLHVDGKDLKTNEFLCEECHEINQRIYGNL